MRKHCAGLPAAKAVHWRSDAYAIRHTRTLRLETFRQPDRTHRRAVGDSRHDRRVRPRGRHQPGTGRV